VQGPSGDLKALIAGCTRGDRDAQEAFQDAYGALIYTFPVQIFRLSEEEAGDFYLYVFDKERIFKRLSLFEGRNAIQFETYLSYYVLRDLCLEWLRTKEQVATVSLDAPAGKAEAGGERALTFQDVLPAPETAVETMLETTEDLERVESVFAQLSEDRRLILKLLALGSMELAPSDVRAIAHMASRSFHETLELLDEVLEILATKAARAQEKWDTLHTVAYWIRTYQHQIAVLEERSQVSRLQGNTQTMKALDTEKAELERKLAWRYRQQAKLHEEVHKAEIRPSFKDIARLLNIPEGTVCSRLARAREEFGHKFAMAKAS
jgi:RNA polymerase sigma factor (sigma-70 family)